MGLTEIQNEMHKINGRLAAEAIILAAREKKMTGEQKHSLVEIWNDMDVAIKELADFIRQHKDLDDESYIRT